MMRDSDRAEVVGESANHKDAVAKSLDAASPTEFLKTRSFSPIRSADSTR
jgi:hypothetical protein